MDNDDYQSSKIQDFTDAIERSHTNFNQSEAKYGELMQYYNVPTGTDYRTVFSLAEKNYKYKSRVC